MARPVAARRSQPTSLPISSWRARARPPVPREVQRPAARAGRFFENRPMRGQRLPKAAIALTQKGRSGRSNDSGLILRLEQSTGVAAP